MRSLVVALVLVSLSGPAFAQSHFGNDSTDFSDEAADDATGVPGALDGAPTRILNAKWVNDAVPAFIVGGPAQLDTVGLLRPFTGSDVLLPGVTGKFHAWYGDWADYDGDARLASEESLFFGASQTNRDCRDRVFSGVNAGEPVGRVDFPAPITAPEAVVADCRGEFEWDGLSGATVVAYISPNRPYDSTRLPVARFERDGRPDLVFGESSAFPEGPRYLASNDGSTYVFVDGSALETVTVETYVNPLPTHDGERSLSRNATEPHDVDTFVAPSPALEALYASTVDRWMDEAGCDKDHGVDGNVFDSVVFPDGSCGQRVPIVDEATGAALDAADAAVAAANGVADPIVQEALGVVLPVVAAVAAEVDEAAGPVVDEASQAVLDAVLLALQTAEPVLDEAVVAVDETLAAVVEASAPVREPVEAAEDEAFDTVDRELQPVEDILAGTEVSDFGLIGPQVAKVMPPRPNDHQGFDYAAEPHTFFDVRLAHGAYQPLVLFFNDFEAFQAPLSGQLSMDASGEPTAPLLAGVYGHLGLWHDLNADGWIGAAFTIEACEDAHLCGMSPDPNDYSDTTEFSPFCRQTPRVVGEILATLTSSTGAWGATGVYVFTDTTGVLDEGNYGTDNSARAFNPWDDAVLDAGDGSVDQLVMTGPIPLHLNCDDPSFGYRSFEHVLFPEGGNRGYDVTLRTEAFDSALSIGGTVVLESVADEDVIRAMPAVG